MVNRRDLDIAAAYRSIAAIARELRAFTTDDVWERIGTASDGRAIANALLRAEVGGEIRNSHIGVYLRGRQAHRRWLAIWLSTALGATDADALNYARARVDA